MEIKKFENSLIAFDFDNEMVNATDMVKRYSSKRINDFLIRKDVKAFIKELEAVTCIPVTIVKQAVSIRLFLGQRRSERFIL